jgi:Domain of unknown function (DUF4864)
MPRPLRAAALLLVLLALAPGAPAARAADAVAGLTEADRAAIREVVGSQLAAFRRDDGAAAYAFASPMIQQMFPSAEVFMTMVRTGYLPVYRPREVEFRGLIDFRGEPTQLVLLVGPDGVAVLAHYMMQRQPDGTWRINGCVLSEAEDQTA